MEKSYQMEINGEIKSTTVYEGKWIMNKSFLQYKAVPKPGDSKFIQVISGKRW